MIGNAANIPYGGEPLRAQVPFGHKYPSGTSTLRAQVPFGHKSCGRYRELPLNTQNFDIPIFTLYIVDKCKITRRRFKWKSNGSSIKGKRSFMPTTGGRKARMIC